MKPDDLARFRALAFPYVCHTLDDEARKWMTQMLAQHPELQTEIDAAQRAADVRQRSGGRLLAWWRRPVQRGWAYALVAALVLIAGVQTFRLAGLEKLPVDATGQSAGEGRGTPDSPAPGVPMLQVIFNDGTTIEQLRKALISLELDIVRGPDEDGTVWLAVPAGNAPKALADIKATGLVTYAAVVDETK